MLHVHDLVDYVSDEAEIAGISAAAYIKGSLTQRNAIHTVPGRGVRYIVPQCVTGGGDELRLFFRSDGVYRDAFIRVTSEGNDVKLRHKRIVTPGEMETVVLKGEELARLGGEITIEVGLKS